MSTKMLIDRLRSLASGDHKRGCQGREYTCSCGYDDLLNAAALEAAEALTASPASHGVVKAATAVLASWDARMHGEREELRNYANNPYWSPRASMVDSEAIAALRAALREAPVAVKALEWRKGYCDETVTIQQASNGWLYQVRVLDGGIWLDWPDKPATEFATLDEAKAAAQQDYETRIRSALTASPASHGVVEARFLRKHANLVRELGSSMSWGALASAMERRADMLDAAPAPALVQGVEAYKAENAKHNWTGRGFSFDPGFLNLGREGDGNIGFAEADMQYERDDETGKDYVYCNVPASEFLALRDYLNKAFPAAAAPEQEKSNG